MVLITIDSRLLEYSTSRRPWTTNAHTLVNIRACTQAPGCKSYNFTAKHYNHNTIFTPADSSLKSLNSLIYFDSVHKPKTESWN